MDRIANGEFRINSSIAPKELEVSCDCITGDTDHLLIKLKESFKKAISIDIIVAFILNSVAKCGITVLMRWLYVLTIKDLIEYSQGIHKNISWKVRMSWGVIPILKQLYITIFTKCLPVCMQNRRKPLHFAFEKTK